MFRKLRISFIPFYHASYSSRVAVDPCLRENFEAKIYKPRKHPGTTRVKVAAIPPDIQKVIISILEDASAKSMMDASKKLSNYIISRQLPPEQEEINKRTQKIYNKISKKMETELSEDLNEEQLLTHEQKVQTKVFNVLKKNIYRWANISYDKATCLQYLMSRAAPEYAIIVRVLDEIKKFNTDYKPRSFFDFGSGVGTGTWAINHYWPKDIFEYFCVDTSPCMHDLSRLILCKGKENVQMPIKGYYQRQFLPASSELTYSIVLSAFTLFEMPSIKARLETIQKLWNKAEDYLIIIEHGSNAGFKIVNEAREFVLNSSKISNGYAFSPCPNDAVCPRYMEHETPCNFLMKYESLPFGEKSEVYAELFSYVILKKGKRPSDDPQWPRVVRAPLVRSGHTICRLCTAQGELKEVIFSKDCILSLKKDFGTPSPVFIRNGMFLTPNRNDGIISFGRSETVLVACPGKSRRIVLNNVTSSYDVMEAHCIINSTFRVDRTILNFKEIRCNMQPFFTTEATSVSCANNNRIHNVGYKIRNKFYTLYSACYDSLLVHTSYVKHTLSPASYYLQGNIKGRPKFTEGTLFGQVPLSRAYNLQAQKSRLDAILGANMSDRYITKKQFLSRGHLAARADFTTSAETRSTFHYVNTAPQWQRGNAGDWAALEEALRRRVKTLGHEVQVYTGSYGVMELPDKNGRMQKFYLYVDENNNDLVPVPMYFFKVVYDPSNKTAAAFVSINSSFYNNDVITELQFCDDICSGNSKFKWLSWQSSDGTHSFCCDYNQFASKINYLPAFNVTGLFY